MVLKMIRRNHQKAILNIYMMDNFESLRQKKGGRGEKDKHATLHAAKKKERKEEKKIKKKPFLIITIKIPLTEYSFFKEWELHKIFHQ